jgi:hypothetical protein
MNMSTAPVANILELVRSQDVGNNSRPNYLPHFIRLMQSAAIGRYQKINTYMFELAL